MTEESTLFEKVQYIYDEFSDQTSLHLLKGDFMNFVHVIARKFEFGMYVYSREVTLQKCLFRTAVYGYQ